MYMFFSKMKWTSLYWYCYSAETKYLFKIWIFFVFFSHQKQISNIKTTEIHTAFQTLDNWWTFLTTVYQQREKKYRQKAKGFAIMLASNSFINKYFYFAKSQFLFISEMLKINLSLKFGKIIRNCTRNSAVSFRNHNENYNASGKLVNENLLSQLLLNIDRNKSRSSGDWIYVRKKREIINYERTIGTNRIKLIFRKVCLKRRVDLEKRLITPNLVVIRQWFYKWKLKQ